MTTKDTILFDLDGTLIDSAPDLAAAVNDMLEKLGRERFDEETIRHWVGNGARILVQRALSGSREIDGNLHEDLLDEALGIFFESYGNALCESTVLYPGVLPTLRRLRNAGFMMAVVTNKPSPFVHPILDTLGVSHLFDLTLGGEDLPRKKPDPLPLLHACERLETTVDRTLMVGDSRNDILASRAAGMESVGVRYGYNYGEPIEQYGPDAVVDRFEEIVVLLGL